MSWTQVRATMVIVSVGALAMGSIDANAQANYLTDLGAVAPALGVNNNGQVVLQNYIYSNGTLTAFPANFTGAAINASGQVAGFDATTGTGNNCLNYCTTAAAIYANGTVKDIPGTSTTPGPIAIACYFPTGINDSGAIVGWYSGECSPPYLEGNLSVWLYSNNALINLGGLAGCGVPTAINDSGQISGYSPCSTEPFIFDVTQSATELGSGQGQGNAINASGQVTGNALMAVPGFEWPQWLGALYSGGAATLLPNAAGTGYGINASAFVVGDGVNATNHAYLYIGAVSLDLNSFVLPNDPLQPYVTLTDARGINDTGLIVVNGVDSRDNSNHAYLLQVPLLQVTPIPAFPVQAVGTTSAGQTVALTNFGTTPIAIGNASTSPGPFNIKSNTCGASLAPNASCTITITFAPTASGIPNGVLTVNAGGLPPIPVPLSGVTPLSITSFATSASTITAAYSYNLTLTYTTTIPANCLLSNSGNNPVIAFPPSNVTSPGSSSYEFNAAGTETFSLSCTAVGSQAAQAQAGPVVIVWPVVTAALSASAPSVAPHQAVTLNWSSSKPAKSCVASGGGTGDGWANSVLPASGSKAVTEPTVPAAGESTTLTFTVTCKPNVAEYPGSASVKVVQKGASAAASSGSQSSSSSGGGGAFDTLSLAFLFGVFALHRVGRRPPASRRRTTLYISKESRDW